MTSLLKTDVFETDKAHFFKIILEDTIKAKKLCIPRKFVKKYGEELSSPVLLEVPGGRKWQVELTKCDGKIWLQNGWQDFLEYYSLAHGSFIVFEYYKRNSHFNVIVFDKSACEIDYPISVTNGDDKEPNDPQEETQVLKVIEETENDVPVKILGDFKLCQKRKEKSPLSSPQPQKMMKVETPTENTSLLCSGKQVEGKSGYGVISGQKQTSSRIVARLNPKKKMEALHRARTNFKSKNPFFLIAMQPSYVHPAEKLNIPGSFSMTYFPKKHDGDTILKGLNGRTWSVKYYAYTAAKGGPTTAKMTKGWRAFAQDNHLEVGDVCAFELIKSAKATFKVTIFRRIKGNNRPLIDEESNPTGAIEASKSFTSVNPFFRLVVSSGHLEHSIVHVPYSFISNIKQSTKKAKLQVENRCWLVKLNLYPQSGKGLFVAGWSVFAKENSLQMGDVCIFELIDSETILVKVTIFRNAKQLGWEQSAF